MRPTYINKSSNRMVTKEYDYQNYVKPLYCRCCDTTIHDTSLDDHKKSEFHQIARRIRSMVPGPIDDIILKIVEYKMIIKYQKNIL
jgi:hypothetical protein